MIAKSRKVFSIFMLVLFLITAIPVNIEVPAGLTEEINSKQEIQGLQHRSNYLVVPITINKVEGTPLTKAQVETNLKKMNEIYNCEVVIFVWDGVIHEIPDPSKPGGAADGKILTLDDRTTVRNQAEQNAGGKGVSITVSSDLGDNTNGITAVGGAHSAMVKVGTDGETWAHEMQHSLGQSHGSERQADEDMDGDGDVDAADTGWDANGDGQITPADRQCNLWGRKSDREGNCINCDAIYTSASKLPGVKAKTRPAQVVISDGQNTKKAGVINDTRGDPINRSGYMKSTAKYIDIIDGGIQINYTIHKLIEFWTIIASSPIDNCTLDFALDNNASTGDISSEFFYGADLRVQFSTMDGVLNNQTLLLWWDNSTKIWMELSGNTFLETNLNETINYDNATGSGWTESFFDVYLSVIVFESPFLEKIGAGPFTMWIVTQWNDPVMADLVNDNTSHTQMTLLNQTVEAITVNNDTVKAGGKILVNGTKFTPNSNVTIYINGENINTIKTDANGSFSANITIPTTLNKNNSIIMARDDHGKMDAIYMDIKGLSFQNEPNLIMIVVISIAIIAAIVILSFYLKRKN